MRKKLIVGSRESRLAIVQSELVMRELKVRLPELELSLLTMKTTGDRLLNSRLDQIGGKGLFVRELDRALLEHRSDCSVHSMKDLPMELNPELPLICCTKREDPRDVLVLPEGRREADLSLPIGTSSRRRALQLARLFPGARFESVRGNVQTRLKKLDEGQYGALVLAAAGLLRLGLAARISRCFTTEEIIPAACQGILAVQGRAGEDYECFAHIADREAETAARAERSFVRALNGSCSSPIAAYARTEGDRLCLAGLYFDEERGKAFRGKQCGRAEEAEQLGAALAQLLKEGGGEEC